MVISKVYLKPLSQHSYIPKSGELGLVVGVVSVEPGEGYSKRPCYKVEYGAEQKVDYIPLSSVESGDYKLVY